MSDLKRFWISFVLIVASSFAMHVLVFSKRQANNQHMPLYYGTPSASSEAFVPQGPPVEGKVIALGSDRFYVDAPTGKRWGFLYSQEGRPELGARVRVLYYQGSPPAAIKVERL